MANSNTDIPSEIENVRVFIRVRPFNKKEEKEGRENIVLTDQKENLIVLKNKNGEHTRPFKFDQIFEENSAQVRINHLIVK